MEPMSADVPPTGVSLDIAYVADPWGDEARDDRVDGAVALAARARRAPRA